MDDTRKALLRSWLNKAANDLRGARILGSADDAPLDTARLSYQPAWSDFAQSLFNLKEFIFLR